MLVEKQFENMSSFTVFKWFELTQQKLLEQKYQRIDRSSILQR